MAYKKMLFWLISGFICCSFVGMSPIEHSVNLPSNSLEDLMPSIESALGQIDRAQSLPQVIAQGPLPVASSETPVVNPSLNDNVPAPEQSPRPMARPDSLCINCSQKTTLADMAFMTCNSKNDYLEDELLELQQGTDILGTLATPQEQINPVIKPTCIKAGLETILGENSKSFQYCAPGKKRPKSGKKRPCVSANYFMMVSNSINLVSQCLASYLSPHHVDQKNSLRFLIGSMAQESGLHMNAGNGSGAAGIGQLTQNAIDAVNRNEINLIKDHLKNMGGDCQRLANDLLEAETPMRGASSYRCDRLSLSKGNPALNLIYSIGNMRLSKKEFEKSIFNDSRYENHFSALSESERSRLETAITVWSHNTGPAGMRTPLFALLNTKKYRKTQITDVDEFLKDLKQAHRDYPNSSYAGRSSAIREKSGYYQGLEQRISNLEESAGGGSCVNL